MIKSEVMIKLEFCKGGGVKMKVYCARYILKADMEGNLVDRFKFEQEKDDKWEKKEYGYFYPDGYLSCRAEDKIEVNSGYYYAKNEKFFDREITKEELVQIELQMMSECVVALENKRKLLIDSLSKQIEYIKR